MAAELLSLRTVAMGTAWCRPGSLDHRRLVGTLETMPNISVNCDWQREQGSLLSSYCSDVVIQLLLYLQSTELYHAFQLRYHVL